MTEQVFKELQARLRHTSNDENKLAIAEVVLFHEDTIMEALNPDA